ncbi:hypothetical protein PUN28_005750 [Cardiocondyla obscurior]|uniref:Uncharacterized protein n=1 Tax=Cardiocondyla obscurior TaxID=286306 RepID=A0AAW2GAZ3_9HYME
MIRRVRECPVRGEKPDVLRGEAGLGEASCDVEAALGQEPKRSAFSSEEQVSDRLRASAEQRFVSSSLRRCITQPLRIEKR